MKRRDLERHLLANGCLFKRHGGSHDTWVHPATTKETSIPRHRELPFGIARAICKQLGVSAPEGKR
jgi:predicted RNA binding protein YcfA (HicA-like mRNA interferase family)